MIVREPLWALLVVLSVSEALALSLAPDEAIRHRRSIRDPVSVTCKPLVENGLKKCRSSPSISPDAISLYAEMEEYRPVECLLKLPDSSLAVRNECQEEPGMPGFFRCSASIPRSFLTAASCRMESVPHRSTVIDNFLFKSSLAISQSRFSVCRKDCERFSWSRFSCVVNEDCRLCMEDFQTFFPGEKMEVNFCDQ